MLIDDVTITVEGGHGGAGLTSFGKKEHSGPDGGNGGAGGNIFFRALSDLTLLNQFTQKTYFSAQDGNPGGANRKTGKDGKDLIINLPIDSTIIDTNTGEEIMELTKNDQEILFCKGGIGGRGNYEFRSPRKTTPLYSQKGKPGEEKNIRIILKLIADYGFIGLPNSGKSSLLNLLTNANAKTGNYNFTTLSPNLGVYNKKVLADIPGLIEGASKGKGLGISFLKHIEKVKVLLHCISSESEDPVGNYKVVRKELSEYNPSLLKKKEYILITKSDLVPPEIVENALKKLSKINSNIIAISIFYNFQVDILKNKIKSKKLESP